MKSPSTAVGLAHWASAAVSTLSGGQRQFLCLLSVLLMRPQTLLLDEPFSGLDAKGKQTLLDLLAQVKAGGGTVIVATHDDAVMQAFDRVITLAEGELVSDTGAAA